jgi:hypothetical protein
MRPSRADRPVLVGVTGPSVLFMINATSYLAVIAALARMRTGDLRTLPRAAGADGGVRAGLQYLAGCPAVLIVLALSFVLGSLPASSARRPQSPARSRSPGSAATGRPAFLRWSPGRSQPDGLALRGRRTG